MESVNFRELIFRTFARKPIDRIVWQPRIMLYYNANRIGTGDPANRSALKDSDDPLKIKGDKSYKYVPPEWWGKDIIDIYKDIRGSIRYVGETFGIPLFYTETDPEARIKKKTVKAADGSILTEIITPAGSVTERKKYGYTVEKPVKKPEDIEVIKYILNHTEFKYNKIMYEAAEETLETLGVPQTYYFRSPYQRCVLEFLGFERTAIWMRRKPALMEDFMMFLEKWDEKAYNVIAHSDVPVLNFGENIDDNLCPPPVFEKYLIPYYNSRVKLLKKYGKFCHIHIDGHFADLLPYLADLPFDGIEALTPYPQGDVKVEDIAANIGDKILLDGIPATLFMPEFSENRLIEFTEKVLDYFSPNLILGVSDELPGNADGRRLRTVASIVERYVPN